MKYLDYSKLAAFRAAHFPKHNFGRVGKGGEYQSDYIDIVRFFGPERINPSNVLIRYDDYPFEIQNPLIDSYAGDVAESMRRAGRLHDGPTVMKLVASDIRGESPSLAVQPTDYALQAGTCFALDLLHCSFEAYGGTLRDYYRRDCETPTVDNNPLAICLGVCGSLVVDEGEKSYLLSVRRSRHLASLESSIGPSVAGVVDYSTDHDNLGALISSAVGAEIEEELNLRQGEYEIVPLAWAIELFRGERPQIFCLIRTTLNSEQLRRRLESIPARKREYESFEFVPLNVGAMPEQKHIESLNFEARMNAFLAEEYLGR